MKLRVTEPISQELSDRLDDGRVRWQPRSGGIAVETTRGTRFAPYGSYLVFHGVKVGAVERTYRQQ